MNIETNGKSPEAFWEDRYASQSGETSGNPTHTLKKYVQGRAAGTALDLGCAKGDDVVWLAKQGWTVLGIDIADAALRHARANALKHGVSDKIQLARHDLAESFPEGTFDLVTASFLQTPFDFPWETVISRAAQAVKQGGLLVTATHQRVAPWSKKPPKLQLADAETLFAKLALDQTTWRKIFVGPVNRIAKLPDGQSAEVTDAVIVLERLP